MLNIDLQHRSNRRRSEIVDFTIYWSSNMPLRVLHEGRVGSLEKFHCTHWTLEITNTLTSIGKLDLKASLESAFADML